MLSCFPRPLSSSRLSFLVSSRIYFCLRIFICIIFLSHGPSLPKIAPSFVLEIQPHFPPFPIVNFASSSLPPPETSSSTVPTLGTLPSPRSCHSSSPFTVPPPPPKTRMFLLLSTACILLQLPNALPVILPSNSSHFPDPDEVAVHLQKKVEDSVSRRRVLASTPSCLTGNPIDDCWRCEQKWANDRQRLADCGIGFGRDALGGKGGESYVVTDSSDDDPVNPKPGTLRYAVVQEDPLWITFSTSTTIRLSEELIVNSFKTIDGRGADVHITGSGCITLQYVSNVIIHNVHIHNCVPSRKATVRSSPTHVGHRGKSDGDGISIYASRKIWIDHCSLSHCTDGLIDAIMGSTGITISNNYFSHHNDVMLLGHSDDYKPDLSMQVTIAFNHFGEGLVQRMPRCRLGYIHVVNNDFTEWEMYAIGGSANPTINSQGNRYIAPENPNAKEVTKRVDCDGTKWEAWDWRSDGDVLENGAVFVPSGAGMGAKYAKAASVEPKSAGLVEQLTMNAGVFGGSRDDAGGGSSSGSSHGNVGDGNGGEYFDGSLGMYFAGGRYTGGAGVPLTWSLSLTLLQFSFITILLIGRVAFPHY